MREAAANIEFEEAARLRDEIKRLQETELAVADDPFARQEAVEERISEGSKGRITKSEGTVSTLLSKPRGRWGEGRRADPPYHAKDTPSERIDIVSACRL